MRNSSFLFVYLFGFFFCLFIIIAIWWKWWVAEQCVWQSMLGGKPKDTRNIVSVGSIDRKYPRSGKWLLVGVSTDWGSHHSSESGFPLCVLLNSYSWIYANVSLVKLVVKNKYLFLLFPCISSFLSNLEDGLPQKLTWLLARSSAGMREPLPCYPSERTF